MNMSLSNPSPLRDGRGERTSPSEHEHESASMESTSFEHRGGTQVLVNH